MLCAKSFIVVIIITLYRLSVSMSFENAANAVLKRRSDAAPSMAMEAEIQCPK